MKNKHLWKPSKFVFTASGCKAAKDPKEVGVGSQFVTNILGKVYEKAIKQHACGLLLDLGCGEVPLYEIYKDYISDNICVDWINTSRENPYLDCASDLNDIIPLKDEKFDTILITDVLEHIQNPNLLWGEMSRLLKPNGKIIVGVPFFYWIHEAPHDYYRYTEYMLRMFCERNGLTVVSLEQYGGALEIILDIIAKHIDFSKILSAIHLSLSNLFINSWIGSKLSVKRPRRFPLGYCLVGQKNK